MFVYEDALLVEVELSAPDLVFCTLFGVERELLRHFLDDDLALVLVAHVVIVHHFLVLFRHYRQVRRESHTPIH